MLPNAPCQYDTTCNVDTPIYTTAMTRKQLSPMQHQRKQIQHWHCIQPAQASLVFGSSVILRHSIDLGLQSLLRQAAADLGHMAILPTVVAFSLEACLLVDHLTLSSATPWSIGACPEELDADIH